MVLILNKSLFHSFKNLINQDSSVNEVTDQGLHNRFAFPYGLGTFVPTVWFGSFTDYFFKCDIPCDTNAKVRRVQSVTIIFI